MFKIIYAAPFDQTQQRQLRLSADEYNQNFRPQLSTLSRLRSRAEFDGFCNALATREFEEVGTTGVYRHPAIPELCCVVGRQGNAHYIVPGNNVILVTDTSFQWTFYNGADKRVKVINGGLPEAFLSTPTWVPKDRSDAFFETYLRSAGENLSSLKLLRGGMRIANLPPSAYQVG